MTPTSKTFWLMRHGPTHAKSFVGWTDLPADLSDTAAIARIDAALPQVPVISSTLDRAIQTANAIQGQRTRLPHDPNLRENHFGDWENLTWSQIQDRDGDLARAVFETPGETSPPNGENWNTLTGRVYTALDALDGDTIVVAHMGVIMAALQRALNCTAYEALGHTIDPLSITTISVTSDLQWSVSSINKIL